MSPLLNVCDLSVSNFPKFDCYLIIGLIVILQEKSVPSFQDNCLEQMAGLLKAFKFSSNQLELVIVSRSLSVLFPVDIFVAVSQVEWKR